MRPLRFVQLVFGGLLFSRSSMGCKVFRVTVDGKDYYSTADPELTPIQPVPHTGYPVTDVASPTLACGSKSISSTSLVVPIQAGKSIDIFWNRWSRIRKGAIITYMARCDNGDCRTFDATKASWFKIAEMGMIDNGMVWATDLLRSNRGKVSVEIPESLKEGVYLLRHEVISLKNQNSEDTKFYPACIQLEVVGGGEQEPTGASIPGVYSKEDPGINFIVNARAIQYPIPGPPLPDFIAGNATLPIDSSSSLPPQLSSSLATSWLNISIPTTSTSTIDTTPTSTITQTALTTVTTTRKPVLTTIKYTATSALYYSTTTSNRTTRTSTILTSTTVLWSQPELPTTETLP